MFIHAAGVEFNQWKMTSNDATCLKFLLFLDFIIDSIISELIEKNANFLNILQDVSESPQTHMLANFTSLPLS